MENYIFYFVIAFAFIFSAFWLFGFATIMKAMLPALKKIWLQPEKTDNPFEKQISDPKNYRCNHCGAALGDKAEVSPSGDAKCLYCHKWFNIYKNA